MATLREFSVDDLEDMGRDIRGMGAEAATMAEAAAEISGYLYEHLLDEQGEPACVMVRIYASQPFKVLPPHLQRVAADVADDLTEDGACLVTLASNGSTELPAGSLPEEYVLPFTDSVFRDIPFMPVLLERLGLDRASALDPRRAVEIRLQHRTFNAYVGRDLADDVELLPNPIHRQVVRERGIKTVVGLGGVLPTGGFLMVMIQSTDDVPDRVVQLLQPLAVAIKAALIPHSRAILVPR